VQNKKLEKLLLSGPNGVHRGACPLGALDNASNLYMMERKFNRFEREINDLLKKVEKIQNDFVSYNFYGSKQLWGNGRSTVENRKTKELGKAKNTKEVHSGGEKGINPTEPKEKTKDTLRENGKQEFDIIINYKDGDRECIVDVKGLPEGSDVDFMEVSLYNSILTIKKKMESLKNDRDGEIYSYTSFSQNFSIPKTGATTKNLKKEMDNGVLKIHIPITGSGRRTPGKISSKKQP
jgi:HSP20 family molecular chaperone IbpA